MTILCSSGVRLKLVLDIYPINRMCLQCKNKVRRKSIALHYKQMILQNSNKKREKGWNLKSKRVPENQVDQLREKQDVVS